MTSSRRRAKLAFPVILSVIWAAKLMLSPDAVTDMMPILRAWSGVAAVFLLATAVAGAIAAGIAAWQMERRSDA